MSVNTKVTTPLGRPEITRVILPEGAQGEAQEPHAAVAFPALRLWAEYWARRKHPR